MSRKLLLTAIATTIAALAGCGEDNSNADAVEIDGAFMVEMSVHHESAIEMAQLARTRAEHPELKQLADSIIASQQREIDQLASTHQSVFAEPIEEGDHGSLGVGEHTADMDEVVETLRSAQPFDRAFIDEMVPHHQGAIEMARIVIAEGERADLAALAQQIIETQSREIEQMNSWREQWYGEPSPAGGVPPVDEEGQEEAPSHEGH
jgi:uncharacterized protein (DUF305 family)